VVDIKRVGDIELLEVFGARDIDRRGAVGLANQEFKYHY
jgi:hypothetical protein